MLIDRSEMLEKLAGADERRFYRICLNASLAGEDYKIRSVCFFAKDRINPAKDFICVDEYTDSFAVVTVETKDPKLIAEAIGFLYELPLAEYELRTNFSEVLTMRCVTDRFESGEEIVPAPEYSISSVSELVETPESEDVEISLLTDELRERFSDELTAQRETYTGCFRDVRRYLLTRGGSLIGYLRAECGYKNYYDVGWVFVPPEMRGHGYAPMLVSYFASDCVNNGFFPNYGFAVTPESERVAVKCGFSKDIGYGICRTLIKRYRTIHG